MSKAANLAGFATAVSPPNDLTVGIITAITVDATNITGTVTGDATGLSGTPDIDVRNITGVAATFTGNVSIAGTLTYEDVTNVDSIGIITARSGVVLTGGDVTLGTGVTISGETSNTFTIGIAGTERIRVSSAGSFGIGTNNPGSKLEILDSAAGGSSYSAIKINNTSYGGGSIDFSNVTTPNLGSISVITEDLSAGVYNDGILVFKTAADASNTERFRIGSRGAWGLSGANYGTSGQVLTSQGSGSAPQWADAAGGAWNYISSVTASNSASVAFTSGIDSTYDIYVITGTQIIPSSDDRLGVRFSGDGGSTWRSTAGDYLQADLGSENTFQNNNQLNILREFGEATSSGGGHFVMYLYSPSYSNTYHFGNVIGGVHRSNGAFVAVGTGLFYQGTTTYNAVQFFNENGNNISTGVFRLYGISNS